MALYDTVANIVSDAAVECGLSAPTDVYASTDANIVQMRVMLKRMGRSYALAHGWKHLEREHTFATVSGTASYALPASFSSMLDQSGWDRTTKRQVVPVGAVQWQYMNAVSVAGVLTVTFRPREATIELYPTPTAIETIAFDYRSRYWVETSGQTTPDKDAPTANTDKLMFDATLMVAALKLEFKRAKGFDTTAAQQDFDAIWASVVNANANAAPVLSLNGIGYGDHLLGPDNVPETGFGS